MSEQLTSKQEIARQLREWYESGWIRGNTLKQKQAELLWAAIGSLTADEPSVNIAQRCLYENGDFACRLEAGHTISHWLISKDRIADEVFDSSSVEIEEQNRTLAEQVSQLEAEIERLRAAEPPSAGIEEYKRGFCAAAQIMRQFGPEHVLARADEFRASLTKDAGECGACDKPGEHCANVHGICSRHGGRAHETSASRCDACLGDGKIEYGHPNAPEPARVEQCKACDGTGVRR